MLGEIRLGFFVDGIGYYKDCSELLYPIDSSSDLKVFKEGTVIEVDEQLFKIQAVELAFIDYPGRRDTEVKRKKPIKMVYVSKAKVEMMGEKTKSGALKVRNLKQVKPLNGSGKSVIMDKGYTKDNFKEDFPNLVKPEKKTKKPKKETVKKTRSRTIKKPFKAGKIKPKTIAKAVKMVKERAEKKSKSAPEKQSKATRRKRCKTCDKLFKNIMRHVCKKQEKQ